MSTKPPFNRSDFPPINDVEAQLLLEHRWHTALNAYRDRHASSGLIIGMLNTKRVMEFERDRLFTDRTLSPKVRELLSHNVRDKITDVVDILADQLCVTRDHVLDYIVIEATKLTKQPRRNHD
jgi:hypothetical protein